MGDKDLFGVAKVGGDALAYCTRCKMELAHVIIAMVGGRPARVQCKTCQSPHNYRSSVGTTSLRKPRVSSPVQRVSVSEHWQTKMEAKKAVSPKAYRVAEEFKAGEIVQHPQFGLGLVEEVKLNGKIVVLFRAGEKVLIHGRV